MKIYEYSIDGNSNPFEIDSDGCDPLAKEQATEQDKKWFEINHHRSHRMRKLIDGEFRSSSTDIEHSPNVTIVRQIEPGVRQRFPVSIYVVVRCGTRQIVYSMSGPENEDEIRHLLSSLHDGGKYD